MPEVRRQRHARGEFLQLRTVQRMHRDVLEIVAEAQAQRALARLAGEFEQRLRFLHFCVLLLLLLDARRRRGRLPLRVRPQPDGQFECFAVRNVEIIWQRLDRRESVPLDARPRFHPAFQRIRRRARREDKRPRSQRGHRDSCERPSPSRTLRHRVFKLMFARILRDLSDRSA